MRYVTPVILFAAAAFVWHYNATHDDSWLRLPLYVIPALKDDVEAQGEWSWRILAGLGVLALVFAIVGDIRNRKRKTA